MTTIRLDRTVDEEFFHLHILEYAKNRYHVESYGAEFNVSLGFLILACSRLSPSERNRLYRAASATWCIRVNREYKDWDMTSEVMS